MFATDDFAFIHIPKTGGTFVRSLFKDQIVFDYARPHGRAADLPSEFRDLPRFCFRRNPWDWYVSVWSYGELPAWAPREFPAFVRASMARDVDPYTLNYLRLPDAQTEILVFERLRTELSAFLDRHGISHPPAIDLFGPNLNASERGSYPSYYDAELRDLVGEANRFGYDF